MKLGITSKLMVSFAIAIFPFFVISGVGHYSLVSITEETKEISLHIKEFSLINQLTIDISKSVQPVHNYLINGDPSERNLYDKEFRHVMYTVGELGANEFNSSDKKIHFAAIKDKLKVFNRLCIEILSIKNPVSSARGVPLMKKLNDFFEKLLINMDEFQQVANIELTRLKEDAEKAERRTYTILMVSWTVSIIFCIAMVYLVSRYFSRFILAIDSAARRIGEGNLNERIDITSNDELGDLIETFNRMAGELQKTTVSKDYFDNIIQTMNDVLFVITPDGKIESVNEAACKLLGYNKEELIGHSVDEIFPPEHPLRSKSIFKQIEKRPVEQRESLCISKDGKVIPVQFSLSKLADIPEGIAGIVCVAQDITFRKRAEEDIKYLSHQMIKIQEEDRENISREIHDNLGGSLLALKIQFHSLFSRFAGMKGQRKKDYQEIMDYIDNLIDISRRISRSLSPVGLKTIGLTRAITDLADRLNRSKKMEIKIDLKSLTLYFPDNWDINIYRIIQESLTNIIKHSNAAKVSITSRSYKNKLIIRIKDNGIGIDFEKLRSEKSEHLGLGLLMMRERAALLKGSFEIISKKGKGTEIKIEIPGKKEK